MKVLFVAFEYPPLASSGVHRSLRFSKYLPQFGITPIVITTDAQSCIETFGGPIDAELLKELPVSLTIERISCPKPPHPSTGFAAWKRIFFALAEPLAKWWTPELEKQLPGLIEKHQPAAIYVSLPPFSMGPLWRRLARQYQLPLVLDFRDLWSQWGSAPHASWLHYRLKHRQEEQCLAAAARVICATSQVREDLLSVHPRIAPEKLVTITNGYDAEISDWSLEKRDGAGDEFIIGYVGSFYYAPSARQAMMQSWWRKKPHRMLQFSPRREDWLYRSPYFFFRAVARLLEKRPELRSSLKIRFAGRKPEWIDAQISEFGLTDRVELVGHLDHKSCLEFQSCCDALLMTSAKVSGGLDYCISSKTFEYFMARKPILGLITEGTQKEILQKSGMAVLCDPDDAQSAAAEIGRLMDGQVSLTPDVAFLKTLHRRELTRSLAEVFLQLKAPETASFISSRSKSHSQ